MQEKPKTETREIILAAIREMTQLEQLATRETLAAHTGLSLSVIDDRVSALIDNGDVLRVQRGVYVPAVSHRPARPISRTILPDDGSSVVEIGDQVLHLIPREARVLGELMSGAGQNFSSIELGHNLSRIAGLLSHRVDNIQRKVAVIGKKVTNPNENQDLFEDVACNVPAQETE